MSAQDEGNVGKRLFLASESGNIAEVESALRLGEELGLRGIINHRGPDEDTPLLIAAYKNHTSVISVLLGCEGVDVNAQDGSDRTAFFWACQHMNTVVVRKLLDRRELDAELTPNSERTPLHQLAYASEYSPSWGAVLRLLVQRTKIDVNARDTYGDTVLHDACRYAEKVILLLRVPGIDVNALNARAYTLLHLALQRKKEFVGILLRHVQHTTIDAKTKPCPHPAQDLRVAVYDHNNKSGHHGGRRGRRGVWLRRWRRRFQL